MKHLLAWAIAAALCFAQSKAPAGEDRDLENALAEAGNSQVEYARALERHLDKYPKSERRAEIVRVLAQASVDLKDKRRILKYGIEAIEAGARNPAVLDHTTRALLDQKDEESLSRAVKYSQLLIDLLSSQRKQQLDSKEPGSGRGRRLDETEFALARARTFHARALGSSGQVEQALQSLDEGWSAYPTSEGARERARWLEKAGKKPEALNAWADSVMIDDQRTASPDRAGDQRRLGELASAAGVPAGDALLAALDRTTAALAERKARLRAFDPNLAATEVLDFTISALSGGKLDLASLKGKVVVFDFWATWCGPCRAQHPLYEQVKKRFVDKPEVVFLAVSTDEDRALVGPFLDSTKWSKQVYFDDGLSGLLRISSIPTTVVLDRQGNVHSRLNGYIADRFVDMLSDRIREALAN
jgi:thiol-disulfide isomerase/thioredoxin